MGPSLATRGLLEGWSARLEGHGAPVRALLRAARRARAGAGLLGLGSASPCEPLVDAPTTTLLSVPGHPRSTGLRKVALNAQK